MKNPNIITHEDDDNKPHDELILSKSKQQKLDFKKSLISEPPSCPECRKIMKQRDLKKCNYCGFHIGYLEKIFPTDLPCLESLTDYSKLFSKQDKSDILRRIETIQKRYPQLYVKVAILPLQPDVEIQQMALWMLNKSPIPEGQRDEDRLWTILLLIDSSAKKSCIAEGYKIEVILTHEITSSILQETNQSLKTHTIPEATKATLKELLINLDHSKKMIKKEYRKYNKRRKQ